MNIMTRKAVIGELRELKHMFQRSYGKYPTCLEEAIDYIYQTPRWIPVSEGLPEEETDVFICNANGDRAISSGSYSTEMKDDFIWHTSGLRFGKVVAWMSLPESYKEEQE